MLEVNGTYGSKVNIQQINLDRPSDENYKLASKYQVRVVPTLIFLDENGELIYKVESFLDAEYIGEFFKEMGVE